MEVAFWKYDCNRPLCVCACVLHWLLLIVGGWECSTRIVVIMMVVENHMNSIPYERIEHMIMYFVFFFLLRFCLVSLCLSAWCREFAGFLALPLRRMQTENCIEITDNWFTSLSSTSDQSIRITLYPVWLISHPRPKSWIFPTGWVSENEWRRIFLLGNANKINNITTSSLPVFHFPSFLREFISVGLPTLQGGWYHTAVKHHKIWT